MLKRTLLIITICLNLISVAKASTEAVSMSIENKTAEVFIVHGQKEFDAGDFEASLESFCRALLVDPTIEVPFQYLNNILAQGKLLAKDKIGLLQLSNLFSEIKNLSKQIRYYENKNEEIRQQLLLNKIDAKYLEQSLSDIKESFYKKKQKFTSDEKTFSIESNEPLNVLNELLSLQIVDLKTDLYVYENQYLKLTTIGRDEINPIKIITSDIQRPLFNQASSQPLIATQKRLNTFIRKETKDPVIDDLLSFQLEKKSLFAKQITLSELTKAFQDLDSRFALGQKIIKEKQSTIDVLQKELSLIKGEYGSNKDLLSTILEKREQELVEAVGILNIYREKYYVARTDFENQKTALIKTKTLLEFKEDVSDKILKEVALKETELQEVSSFLNIYKDKLKDVQKIVKAKKMDIKTLEEQLAYAQQRLFEREKVIKRAQQDFELVTNKINDLEKDLKQFKGNVNLDFDQKNKIDTIQLHIKELKELVKNNIHLLELSDGFFALK